MYRTALLTEVGNWIRYIWLKNAVPYVEQCSGSGSASGSGSIGSVCYWASGSASGSVIYLYGSGSGSFHQQAKKMKKKLDFYCFVTSLNKDINVPSKKKQAKRLRAKKNNFCWHLVGHWRKEQDPKTDPLDSHPDPLVKGKNPRNTAL